MKKNIKTLFRLDEQECQALNRTYQKPKIYMTGTAAIAMCTDGSVMVLHNPFHYDFSDWTSVTKISCGKNHLVGLRADGTVLAAGENKYGQCDVFSWNNVIDIAASEYMTIGLTASGECLKKGRAEAPGDSVTAEDILTLKNTIRELRQALAQEKKTISLLEYRIAELAHISAEKKEGTASAEPPEDFSALWEDALNQSTDRQNKKNNYQNSKNRCFGCMQRNNGEQVCPICGFNRDTVQNAPFMPFGTELQDGDYIVGKKLDNNAEGARYIGYSKAMDTSVIISEFLPAGICGRANGKKKVVIRKGYEEQFNRMNEEYLSYYRSIARLRDMAAIAPIFDIFSENGVSYTVSEAYESIPFTEYISRRNGSIDWNTARPLFMPLISALSALHASGIGHYAISPDHLVVTTSDKLRLTDFALKEFRQTGGIFEPELMDGCAAPEQYKEIGVLDEATDIYGFTATLFYALTGRLPENSNERKTDGKLSIPTSVYKRLPPHIVSALVDGLQVPKLSRIATFEDMREMLSSNPPISDVPIIYIDKKNDKRKKGVFGWRS